MSEKKKELPKKTTYEKPVSLAVASFNEVLEALLNTKPMPKEVKRKDNDNQES